MNRSVAALVAMLILSGCSFYEYPHNKQAQGCKPVGYSWYPYYADAHGHMC